MHCGRDHVIVGCAQICSPEWHLWSSKMAHKTSILSPAWVPVFISLISCLSSVRKELLLRLLVCRDHLPWCRKYDDRTLVHAASLIRNQRNLNVAAELNLYRNTAQTCPELHPLHDSKSVEVIFMVPHHTTCVSSENVFLLQKMRNEFSVFFSLPILSSFFPLHYIVSSWTLSITTLRTIFILRGPKECYLLIQMTPPSDSMT